MDGSGLDSGDFTTRPQARATLSDDLRYPQTPLGDATQQYRKAPARPNHQHTRNASEANADDVFFSSPHRSQGASPSYGPSPVQQDATTQRKPLPGSSAIPVNENNPSTYQPSPLYSFPPIRSTTVDTAFSTHPNGLADIPIPRPFRRDHAPDGLRVPHQLHNYMRNHLYHHQQEVPKHDSDYSPT